MRICIINNNILKILMFKLVIVGTIVGLATAFKHPVNTQMVNTIRERTSRWEAHDVETNPLRNYSIEKLKGMLGTITNPPEIVDGLTFNEPALVEALPASWDWREQTPNCVH